MATFEEQLAALNEAIASGERQVALGSQQVTYRSIAELIAARNELKSQMLEAAKVSNPQPTTKRTFLYQQDRGFHAGSDW